jgi:hypothetical protein
LNYENGECSFDIDKQGMPKYVPKLESVDADFLAIVTGHEHIAEDFQKAL